MPTFTPPSTPPAIVEYAVPEYGRYPAKVSSHGYDYIVTGNTLLPPAMIKATIVQAVTPKAAIKDLLKVYHARGYLLVAVKAEINGHQVNVSVIEGMIVSRQIPGGIQPFFPNTVDRSNLKNHELLEDQIMASAYAARSGHHLAINLSPASNPGGAVLAVQQTKIPGYSPISGAVSFGNYGNRYASGYVTGAQVEANLTHGVTVTANFTQGLPSLRAASRGSNYYSNGVGISVVRPFGIYGFQANWTHFRLGDRTAPLNPDGNIFSYQFTGNQLLYADTATKLSAQEGFYHVRYRETAFNGFYTLLQQNYSYLSMGTTLSHGMTVLGRAGSVTGNVDFNLGISPPSGTLYDNIDGVPTPHFRYTVVSLSYNQELSHGMSLELSGHAQWSPSTLPSQQQWVLGGFGNLTAWEPGSVVGDSGYVTRLQLNLPSIHRLGGKAKLAAFIETGGTTYAHPYAGTSPWQSISDIGLSLGLVLPYKISVNAMTALPIADAGFTGATKTALNLSRINAFFVVQKGF